MRTKSEHCIAVDWKSLLAQVHRGKSFFLGAVGPLTLPTGRQRSAKLFLEICVMKTTFTVAACAALMGLSALAPSAFAEQKTIKQCNDEWAADQAAIAASGKTKQVFVAECRGVPIPARTAVAVPLGKGQYASEAEAKTTCSADTVVWVNLKSRVYHVSGSGYYGLTRAGAYMCQKDSLAAGFRAPKASPTATPPAAAPATAAPVPTMAAPT